MGYRFRAWRAHMEEAEDEQLAAAANHSAATAALVAATAALAAATAALAAAEQRQDAAQDRICEVIACHPDQRRPRKRPAAAAALAER